MQTSLTDNNIEILIAEDSPAQAEPLRYFLELNDYRVTLANNGRHAINWLNDYRPSLVISDINLPEISGFELCQYIKSDERTRNIPVVLLTSLSDQQDVVGALSCGADSFVTKPYSEDYLLTHIKQILSDTPLRSSGRASVELLVNLAGKLDTITADCQQMLSLLLSTYEAAAQRNRELVQTQAELNSLNEHLEELVAERTASLSAEIVMREHLQNELHALSWSDELTGLNNRRGFMVLAEQYWRLAVRTKRDFTLLYMDLDNFKYINDTFGHAQGDRALQAVARVLGQIFRDSDILARFGGDEFTVLCTDCDLASAQAAATRLRETLEQAHANSAVVYNLTPSVGLAHFNAKNRSSIRDLLAQADADMYAHKLKSQGGGRR